MHLIWFQIQNWIPFNGSVSLDSVPIEILELSSFLFLNCPKQKGKKPFTSILTVIMRFYEYSVPQLTSGCIYHQTHIPNAFTSQQHIPRYPPQVFSCWYNWRQERHRCTDSHPSSDRLKIYSHAMIHEMMGAIKETSLNHQLRWDGERTTNEPSTYIIYL